MSVTPELRVTYSVLNGISKLAASFLPVKATSLRTVSDIVYTLKVSPESVETSPEIASKLNVSFELPSSYSAFTKYIGFCSPLPFVSSNSNEGAVYQFKPVCSYQ